MKTPVRIVLVFSLIAIAVQGSPRQNAPHHSIRARIIDGLTGEPVPRVRFALSGRALQDGIAGNGDMEGNVVIAEIPAGLYQLSITKAQFFDFPLNLNLTNIDTITLPDIAMTKMREISGVARWQDGEPAARTQMRVIPIRGGRISPRPDSVVTRSLDGLIEISSGLVPASSNSASAQVQVVIANDRGEFAFTSLRPGRYLLMAKPTTATGGIDPLGRSVAGGVPRLGLPVYYPGLISPDIRSIIDVRDVLNVPNINVVIEEKEGTLVEGTVIPSTVAPIGLNINLTLSIPGLLSFQTAARVGDSFQFTGVPAGTYVLDAQTPGLSRGRLLQSVVVAGAKTSGLTLSIPAAAEVSGRVEIDDPSVRPTASLILLSDRNQGQTTLGAAANGEFRVPGLGSGELYTMIVSRIPPSSYLAAVMQGTREFTNAPYPIYVGGDPIRILLKTDGGVVNGIVKQNGLSVQQAFVVAAPKDRKKEQNFRIAVSSDNGSFQMTGLAPGEYDLFALDRNEEDDYLDEEFLQTLTGKSITASVAPRSIQTLELLLQNIPRR